jgi:hypothetical protein
VTWTSVASDQIWSPSGIFVKLLNTFKLTLDSVNIHGLWEDRARLYNRIPRPDIVAVLCKVLCKLEYELVSFLSSIGFY